MLNDFYYVYLHSPFMWLNTCIAIALFACISERITFFLRPLPEQHSTEDRNRYLKQLHKNTTILIVFAFLALCCGAIGYFFAESITQTSLEALNKDISFSDKHREEFLRVAQQDMNYNLQFAGVIIAPAVLAFAFFKRKAQTIKLRLNA